MLKTKIGNSSFRYKFHEIITTETFLITAFNFEKTLRLVQWLNLEPIFDQTQNSKFSILSKEDWS